MSAPPSGFAPRPAARITAAISRYRTLALAATLLAPCAARPLQAATKHAPQPHKAAAAKRPIASSHGHAEPVAKRTAPVGKRHAEIARAEAAAPRSRHAAIAPIKTHTEAAPEATATDRLSPREAALAAKAAAYHKAPAQKSPVKTTAKLATSNAKAPVEDAAADQSVQDRVHAWMRSRGTEVSATTAASPKPAKVAPEADLSTSPRKATSDDFARAAQRQTQTLRAVAAQNQARTTTADDDAAALVESQIPSTAPTARVPLPFTHGDLLAADATTRPADFTQQPATLTNRPADAAALRKPDTRTDTAALATTASAGDAGVTPAPIRIVSAQTAASTTPKLQLPKPASVMRTAPAVTILTAAAKHPALDPGVASAMASETFDGNAPAPTAATAIALSAKATRPALIAADDEDPDTRSTGAIAKVDLYDNRGHLRLIPAMKGTHEILVHQNQMAVADGLDRIEDDEQLYDMRRLRLLVALPDNDAVEVNPGLPANRRYARPWSVRFLNDLSRAHYARFHTPLIITSAVRTVAFQRRLVLTNGNAAPPTGDVASPHLYGQAIDLGKHGMSITEIAWMRAYLTPVEDAGKIDVEEEFQQACFHISVYRRYLGLPSRKNTPRPDVAPSRTLLQAKTAPAPAKRRRLPSALLATGLR